MSRRTSASNRRRSRFAHVALVVLVASVAQTPGTAQSIDELLEAGRVEEALPRIEARLEQDPDDAEAHLQRSTARIILGDLDGGRGDLRRALELDPTLRQAWLNQGALALADEDLDAAVEAFRRARGLDPEALDGPLNLGVALLMRGDLESADDQLAEYLERSAESGEAHYLVATNHAMMGHHGRALDHLGKAIERDERTRLRARTDPNWRPLAADPAYVRLLETDRYLPPLGALHAGQEFDAPYEGGGGPMLNAVLNALHELGIAIDEQVELTSSWALIWSSTRIKVAALDEERSRVELTAPPGQMTPETWQLHTDEIFRQVAVQLAMLHRAPPTPESPDGGR